jgi:hypothetical protein
MNRSFAGEETLVSIGYMRVSKADGSQVVDLQRDALAVTGVAADQLDLDRASGKRGDWPGFPLQGETLLDSVGGSSARLRRARPAYACIERLSGVDVLRALSDGGWELPVIVITGRDEPISRRRDPT